MLLLEACVKVARNDLSVYRKHRKRTSSEEYVWVKMSSWMVAALRYAAYVRITTELRLTKNLFNNAYLWYRPFKLISAKREKWKESSRQAAERSPWGLAYKVFAKKPGFRHPKLEKNAEESAAIEFWRTEDEIPPNRPGPTFTKNEPLKAPERIPSIKSSRSGWQIRNRCEEDLSWAARNRLRNLQLSSPENWRKAEVVRCPKPKPREIKNSVGSSDDFGLRERCFWFHACLLATTAADYPFALSQSDPVPPRVTHRVNCPGLNDYGLCIIALCVWPRGRLQEFPLWYWSLVQSSLRSSTDGQQGRRVASAIGPVEVGWWTRTHGQLTFRMSQMLMGHGGDRTRGYAQPFPHRQKKGWTYWLHSALIQIS